MMRSASYPSLAFSGVFMATSFYSFDLDLPLECDDEYWETGFDQPAGKPSTITYFNRYLSLMNILSSTMRLIVLPIFL